MIPVDIDNIQFWIFAKNQDWTPIWSLVKRPVMDQVQEQIHDQVRNQVWDQTDILYKK